ncbi:MAG: hypothetical protein ACRCWI_06780 [Brevinema sp.]
MIKKFSLLLIILGVIACENNPNNFTAEANAFLDAINGKEYQGTGTYANSRFTVTATIIAEYTTPPSNTEHFRFINVYQNSTTQGIYKINREERYIGVVIEDNGQILQRTPETSTPESITWSAAVTFATR